MRSRTEILKDIVCFKYDLPALQNEILDYPWDIEKPVLSISREDMLVVLKKFINKDITDHELEEWANLIECREDLGFDEGRLEDIIFTLANPDIDGKITEDKVNGIIGQLVD